jgi:hypothetical protein
MVIKKNGGKVIASGGFGCVFNPALLCKNTTKRDKNKVTKLMKTKHAISEYNEINLIKNSISNIPNYEDYFLVNNFTICEPAPLTKEDLDNYSKKCTALPKSEILKDNINNSLDKILALNMPNGGIAIDDFMKNNNSYYNLVKINNCLINLLKFGVIPMNKLYIFHCDIKDSNILIESNNNKFKTRLIDWGLTTKYVPNTDQTFPSSWKNRPLQYNSPFSLILFTDVFIEKYTKYCKKGGIIDHIHLKPFVIDYIFLWIKERGPGHYKFINKIMNILFGNELNNIEEPMKVTLIENEFTMIYISNYLIQILIHFTHFRKDGSLNLRIYLDNVFIKIVDIWGLISSYMPFLEILHENYRFLDTNQLSIFNELKKIFIKYLYDPRIDPISIPSLTKDLKKLNHYFEIKTTNTNSKISSSLKTLTLNTRQLSLNKKTKKKSYSSKSKNHSSTQKII